jgi:hypothetical protein
MTDQIIPDGPCKHAAEIFEAARETGICRGTFGRWKRGECSPTSKTLDKLWTYLHSRRAERVPRIPKPPRATENPLSVAVSVCDASTENPLSVAVSVCDAATSIGGTHENQ